MGAAWERMISSMQRFLAALIATQILTEEVMAEVMTEIKSIINSRSLVLVTINSKNDEPVTSNHLHFLCSNPGFPPGLRLL